MGEEGRAVEVVAKMCEMVTRMGGGGDSRMGVGRQLGLGFYMDDATI